MIVRTFMLKPIEYIVDCNPGEDALLFTRDHLHMIVIEQEHIVQANLHADFVENRRLYSGE